MLNSRRLLSNHGITDHENYSAIKRKTYYICTPKNRWMKLLSLSNADKLMYLSDSQYEVVDNVVKSSNVKLLTMLNNLYDDMNFCDVNAAIEGGPYRMDLNKHIEKETEVARFVIAKNIQVKTW